MLTRDRPKGERIAAELMETGLLYVNSDIEEDPRLPFGGIKASGYGPEMSSYGSKNSSTSRRCTSPDL